jgi:hypothetical protein
MSFFGDYKRARVVNLGNASTISARDLLERNKKAREERMKNEREESAKRVLARWINRLILRKREFVRLLKMNWNDKLSNLYSVFFPFVTMTQWMEILPRSSPNPLLLKKLVRLAEKRQVSDFDHAIWKAMQRDNFVDFVFLKRLAVNNKEIQDVLFNFSSGAASLDYDGYIRHILTLPNITPPRTILEKVSIDMLAKLSKDETIHLFCNLLRIDPLVDVKSHFKLVYWGLVNLDLFQIYQKNDTEDEDLVFIDCISHSERVQIDKLGTLDYIRLIFAASSKHKLEDHIPILCMIFYRYVFFI